jgi:hypothetical protein
MFYIDFTAGDTLNARLPGMFSVHESDGQQRHLPRRYRAGFIDWIRAGGHAKVRRHPMYISMYILRVTALRLTLHRRRATNPQGPGARW